MRIVFSALLLALAATNAGAVDFNCEGCSPEQMQSRALGFGRGEHRIYSFSTGTAFVFTVMCSNARFAGAANTASDNDAKPSADPTPPATGCQKGARLQVATSPLSPEEDTVFALANKFLKDHAWNRQGPNLTYDTGAAAGSSPRGDSVYGILNDFPARQNLFGDIQSKADGFTQYAAVLAAMKAAHFEILSHRIIIPVTFRDGSSVRVIHDGDLHTFELIPSTARNNVGKPIVESNNREYAGIYDLTGANVDAYLNYLRSLGIPIVGGESGGNEATCVWSGAGNTLTCKVL